jgi:hypothetical protein
VSTDILQCERCVCRAHMAGQHSPTVLARYSQTRLIYCHSVTEPKHHLALVTLVLAGAHRPDEYSVVRCSQGDSPVQSVFTSQPHNIPCRYLHEPVKNQWFTNPMAGIFGKGVTTRKCTKSIEDQVSIRCPSKCPRIRPC